VVGAVPDGFALPPRVDLVRATTDDDIGAAVVLVRPDGYLSWATDSSADCGDALRSAIAGGIGAVEPVG